MSKTSVEVVVTGIEETLPVVDLRGVEGISRPFRFDLVVAVPVWVDARGLVDADARFTLDARRADARHLGGYVAAARVGHRLADGTRTARVRVVPHWSRLSERRTSRIFQDASSIEIARIIAAEHGLALIAEATTAPVLRGYAVQHQETDLDFLERLFAEEGLAYCFADLGPADTRHAVVVLDAAGRYAPILGDSRLELHSAGEDGGLRAEEHHVHRFTARARSRPRSHVERDFDLMRPDKPLEARAGGGAPDRRGWYEHSGPYGEAQPSVAAGRSLEQLRRDALVARGESACRRLAPGRVFDLDGDDSAVTGRYAVTRVRHTLDARVTGALYRSAFEVVASDILLRPPRPPPRHHQILETATVVGPANEEIHTDALGRIKVQFHWDRERVRDDRSSCWIRVSQPWAGAGWGTQFIPRIGMEVIVGFLHGDVDRPLVLGCVENATHLAPFALPAQKTRSGIKTNSVGLQAEPGRIGYNELSFEDRGGDEQVRLRAQRNLSVEVLEDSDASVGQHASVTIGGDLDVRVRGARRTVVSGLEEAAFDRDQRVTVNHDAIEYVRQDKHVTVGASYIEEIAGNSSSAVGGDRADAVTGSWATRVRVSHLSTVGTTDFAGELGMQSTGAIWLNGERKVDVRAGDSVCIRSGASILEVTPAGITLSADKIRLSAKSIVATGDGPSLELGETTRILSDEVRILGKSGFFELTEETLIRGSAVKLGPSEPKPPVEDPANEDATKTLKVKLTDELFHPYAGKRYEARAGAAKLQGTTGGDGVASFVVPKDATMLLLTLWVADYPEGKRREYALQLKELPDVDLVAGAQERLRNLGYYNGATTGLELDGPTAAALRMFQRDHGLELSGQLDDATQAALTERHGN